MPVLTTSPRFVRTNVTYFTDDMSGHSNGDTPDTAMYESYSGTPVVIDYQSNTMRLLPSSGAYIQAQLGVKDSWLNTGNGNFIATWDMTVGPTVTGGWIGVRYNGYGSGNRYYIMHNLMSGSCSATKDTAYSGTGFGTDYGVAAAGVNDVLHITLCVNNGVQQYWSQLNGGTNTKGWEGTDSAWVTPEFLIWSQNGAVGDPLLIYADNILIKSGPLL